jgi:hypothetical protein
MTKNTASGMHSSSCSIDSPKFMILFRQPRLFEVHMCNNNVNLTNNLGLYNIQHQQKQKRNATTRGKCYKTFYGRK